MPTTLRCALVIAVTILAAAPVSAWSDFLVLTTDFQTYGGGTVVDRLAPWGADVDAASISSDAVARWHDGLYYVLNRGAANIQVLDPADGYATLRQFSLGAGRNPQDIAFAPDGTAYVSCYDEAVFLKIDPVAGVVLDTWSTAPFADADGLPETSWMKAVGGLLYITCQRLDRDGWWYPAGGSRLLVFDMLADDWYDVDPGTPAVDGVMLAGQNPSAQLQVSPDGTGLLVATTGHWLVDDAGLESVDLATLQTGGFLVTDQMVGGDIIAFSVLDAEHGWCIVSDGSFHTQVKTFDPAGGPGTLVAGASSYAFVDVTWDGDDLIYLCDRTQGAAGLRVFDAWTGIESTSSPIGVGRPPAMCVLPQASGITAVDASTPGAPALRAPWPNPANPQTSIAFTAAPGERVRVEVRDLRGRRLRTVDVTTDGDGDGRFVFDGYDDRGRPLATGVYRAVIRSARGAASRGFSLVR